MSDLGMIKALASSGMRAQATRLRHISENIANVDTPGYHRKIVAFRNMVQDGTVATGPVQFDQRPLKEIYDPGHPLADGTGHYDGSNVDLMVEIADAREAQRSYEANLKLFDQARQMKSGLLDLLRR